MTSTFGGEMAVSGRTAAAADGQILLFTQAGASDRWHEYLSYPLS